MPPIVPSADPVAALATGLAAAARHVRLDWTVEQVRHRLDEGDLTKLTDELLLATPGGSPRRLLVVVDQLEELLTTKPRPAWPTPSTTPAMPVPSPATAIR